MQQGHPAPSLQISTELVWFHILGQSSEESIHGDLLVHNCHNNQQAPGYIGVTTVMITIVRVNNISPIHSHPNSQVVGVSSKKPFPDCQ